MFVVCLVQKVELESKSPRIFPFPVTVDVTVDMGKMIGYLPCYETKEDALADYPDAPIVQAKFVKDGEVK